MFLECEERDEPGTVVGVHTDAGGSALPMEFVERLRRAPARGPIGYDLVLAQPRSWSALWALADPPIVEKMELAHTAAVRMTLSKIREQLCPAGGPGVHGVQFEHRATTGGSPHRHTHLVFGAFVLGRDKEWVELNPQTVAAQAERLEDTFLHWAEQYSTALAGLRYGEPEATV